MSQRLIIQPLSPLSGETVFLEKGSELTLSVQITLGCGCPTCAGGRWDASRFRVNAHLEEVSKNGKSHEIILHYSGRASEFEGSFPVNSFGKYRAEIAASDPETGSAGRCYMDFSVKPRLSVSTS